MGRDPTIMAFHPTDKIKSTKSSQKILEASGPEDPLSDDEMEEEYRSVLVRKSDKKTAEEDITTK